MDPTSLLNQQRTPTESPLLKKQVVWPLYQAARSTWKVAEERLLGGYHRREGEGTGGSDCCPAYRVREQGARSQIAVWREAWVLEQAPETCHSQLLRFQK